MKTVRQLSAAQAAELREQLYCCDSYFNPVQDGDGVWIISEEEATHNENADFAWVSALPSIPYVAPPVPIFSV